VWRSSLSCRARRIPTGHRSDSLPEATTAPGSAATPAGVQCRHVGGRHGPQAPATAHPYRGPPAASDHFHEQPMHIRDWPSSERPREKLLARGAPVLSDAELLALFLRSEEHTSELQSRE